MNLFSNTSTTGRNTTFFKVVMKDVFAKGHQFEILNAVVLLVSVYVMNDLIRIERASEVFRHYITVLKDHLIGASVWMIGFVDQYVTLSDPSPTFPHGVLLGDARSEVTPQTRRRITSKNAAMSRSISSDGSFL